MQSLYIKPSWTTALEEAYEKIGFEKSLLSEINTNHFPAETFFQWLESLHHRDFKTFFQFGRDINNQDLNFDERVFALSWLIIGCEVNYDLASRTGLLNTLKKLAHLNTGFYADMMVLYFEGVSAYFESDFDTAELKFKSALKLFENANDFRQMARCYLHLALVYQQQGFIEEAQKYIKVCIDICSRRNFYKTKNRALDLYVSMTSSQNTTADFTEGLKSTNDMNSLVQLIEHCLLQKDLQMARVFISRAEKLRKSQGYKRGKFSLYKYLIQLNLISPATQKLGYLGLDSLKDPAVYLELVNWMIDQNISPRTIDLARKRKLEIQIKKIESLEFENSNSNNEYKISETIRLSQVTAKDVGRLIEFLYSQGKSCSKEQIFEHVYGISYDPIIHDSKLYKLILKAKKTIAQDFLINHYGEYSVNLKKYRLVK